MLNDALCNQGIGIDGLSVGEQHLETGNVHRGVLNAVVVNEAGELGETHRERLLTTLEALALAATGAGELALGAAAGGGAVTGRVAAADALAVLARALSGTQIVELHE